MRWTPLAIPDDAKGEKFKLIIRLNALGSLYFFEKFVLQRTKLSEGLHKPILLNLEADRPRYLLELPRDHYKTVMATEGRRIWRSLPFTEVEEAAMRELGYDDAWIAWMKRCHIPGRRSLIVSEVQLNAEKIGHRFDWHYAENQMFRYIFSDILPDAKCIWNNTTKQQKCAARGPQGEGTYDFLGVGGALQSRHYNDVDEDDVIGKDALESELVMDKTIDYHRLLIGAFESYQEAAWTVTNNRWAPNDLSGWIRLNQVTGPNRFYIESHSALGGCCPMHPPDQPIFPEEFSRETLEEIRAIQGPYMFSHQYLNLPINPEECIFKPEWLRYYSPTKSPLAHQTNKHWLRHEVVAGETIKDIDPNTLVRTMVVDPNHAEERGRAHHGVVITGLDPENDRVYLLDVWAKSTSYDELMHTVYDMAAKWGLPEFWLETVAAQRTLKYHIEYRNKVEKRNLVVKELKTDRGANSKRVRIEALEPVLRDGRLWVRRDQSAFIDEYMAYPGGRTVDVLDCLGYSLQTWNAIHAARIIELISKRKRNSNRQRSKITGY